MGDGGPPSGAVSQRQSLFSINTTYSAIGGVWENIQNLYISKYIYTKDHIIL